MPSFYEQKSKELDTSDNITLFKVIGNGGNDSFYIKVISDKDNQYCKPIIPKKYYCLLPDYLTLDFFIKNYDPLVDIDNAVSFWLKFIAHNFNIEFRSPEVINLGIKKQSELQELWEIK